MLLALKSKIWFGRLKGLELSGAPSLTVLNSDFMYEVGKEGLLISIFMPGLLEFDNAELVADWLLIVDF